MIDVREYLSQTEHAVKGMFDLLSYYEGLFKDSVKATPSMVFRHSGNEVELSGKHQEWLSQPSIQEAHNSSDALWNKHSATLFSKHVISGSILQIAHKAIELLSSDRKLKPEYEFLFQGVKDEKRSKYFKFLIGREVKGVPIGLIIYAGRNQYSHFDEETLKDIVNVRVFDRLASEDGSDIADKNGFKDPSFDLKYNKVIARSSVILSVMGWKDYSSYHTDIIKLIDSR